MNDMTKELIEFLEDTNSYSNFIESQNGGNNYYYLLEQQEGKILIDYINQLQSNWNSLREWLEKQKEDSKTCKEWNNKKGFNDIDYERDIKRFDFVLDKMNKLEGKNN